MRPERGRLATRAFLTVAALAGAFWVWFIFANDLQDTPSDDLATKLAAGQDFAPEALEAVAARDDHGTLCDLKPMRERLAARFELMNLSIEGAEIDRIDSRSDAAETATTNLLTCSPQDAFGWFVRYVVESRQFGLLPRSITSLTQSYRYGAREPWIAVRRNRRALAVFDYLPPDLQEAVVGEFKDILNAFLTDEAIDGFVLAKPKVQDKLVQSAMTLSDPIKRQFIARIQARNINYDFSLYDDRPERPWR